MSRTCMSLILSGFSLDELERYVLCAPPDMAAAAKAELNVRGVALDAKQRELDEIDADIELAEDDLRSAEMQVEDAEDELIRLRRRRKELEAA